MEYLPAETFSGNAYAAADLERTREAASRLVSATVFKPADDLRPRRMSLPALGLLMAAALAMLSSAVAADLKTNPPVSVGDARASCIAGLEDDAGESCTVSEFGDIGAVDGHPFHYAVHQYRNEGNRVLDRTRVMVFEVAPAGMMRAVAATESDPAVSYDKPRLLRSSGRVLLHIPGSESGTGNFNRERLFVWRDGQWGDVDTTGWLDELARRLPKGYGAWKGIYPDYVRMKASTPLWREGDGNACGSGGRADLVLGWQADRIVLRGIQRRKAGECGEELPRRRRSD